ncbi:MAG: Ig-like domain-containing protein [Bacteroidota bacterium]
MNISNPTLKHLALWLFVLLYGSSSFAQGYQQFQILQDEVFEYYFFSSVTPTNPSNPSNGVADIDYVGVQNGQLRYVLRYTPDPGFVGIDSTDFQYFINLDAIHLYFEIEVVEHQVVAENDYHAMATGTTATIDILGNDFSSSGIYNLLDLPLVSNGTASININDQIDFTPDPGFVGQARFHYTLCDDFGTCDVGLATVFVEDPSATNDTIYLATKKNQRLDILIPTGEGYGITDSPEEGTVLFNGGILEYIPNINYSGTDQFTCYYQFNGVVSLRTYIIDVIFVPDVNNFALDDYGFTPVDNPIQLNVLDNDLGNNLTVVNYTDPSNGTLVEDNGTFQYVPSAGFDGLDQFTYQVCVVGSTNCETARVFVGVSDHEPSAVTYRLTTPENTPLVVNYNIPINSWEFIIANDGETDLGGTSAFYPGIYSEGPILGQSIEGFNLLIYTPPLNTTGVDEFEVNYCTQTACKLVKIQVDIINTPPNEGDTLCIADCVWAGDANYDGQVDMTDLLPIGYCVGERGGSRPNGSLTWYGQFGPNWNNSIGNTLVDIKHVDTNGDGAIMASDTAGLSAFYGLTHNLTPKALPAASNIPLYFVPITPDPQPGDLVQIDVVLGTATEPAIDINGLTFALNYNAAIVEEGTMQVDFYNDSWMAYDAPTLELSKAPFLGRLDAGYTRTGGASASGYGVIGQISFIVIDDIDGARPGDSLAINMNNAYSPVSMNSAGQYVSLQTYDPTVFISFKAEEAPKAAELMAYPNPSQDLLRVHLNGGVEMEQVNIYTLTGQTVFQSGDILTNHLEIDVTQMPNNMYVVQAITTDKEVISQKIQIMKE